MLKHKKGRQTICNPFIIIVGICDYSNARNNKLPYYDLNGVLIDMEKMYYLWKNIYNYNNYKNSIKLVCNGNPKNIKNSKLTGTEFVANSNQIVNDESTFVKFLNKCRTIIDYEECFDSLIFIYSGHGIKDSIILANGDSVELEKIYNKFNGEICEQLRHRCKIFVFDCCRGEQFAFTYEKIVEMEEKESNGNDLQTQRSRAHDTDNRYHASSGFATIFSNCINYKANESNKFGGCLIRAIYKTFEKPQLIVNYALRDLILVIRQETKQFAGIGIKKRHNTKTAQCVDFHESLEFKVYFQRNENNANRVEKTQMDSNNNNEENSQSSSKAKGKKKSILFFWQ